MKDGYREWITHGYEEIKMNSVVFKRIGEDGRTNSYSTNQVQNYLDARNSCIGALMDALKYFESHRDFRAFEFIEKAVNHMQMAKDWEARSNFTCELLELCADRISGMQKGIGYTETDGESLVQKCKDAAFGKFPGVKSVFSDGATISGASELPDGTVIKIEPQQIQPKCVGWKSVPIIPTGEMGQAGYKAWDEFDQGDEGTIMGPEELHAIYRAMINAAPSI